MGVYERFALMLKLELEQGESYALMLKINNTFEKLLVFTAVS